MDTGWSCDRKAVVVAGQSISGMLMSEEDLKAMVRFVGKFILAGVLIIGAGWLVANSFTYVDDSTVTQQIHEQLCPDEGTYVIGGKEDWVIFCKDRRATVYRSEEI